jgi:5-methylthioribose kinase
MPEGTPLDTTLARLVERHVLPAEALSPDADLRVESLRGGVSADVFVVTFGARRLVVKQPLLRLRVAQEWLASPTRARVEAEAIAFAGRIRPENVPEIVDIDDEHNVIVMTAAPPDMDNWKARLLTGDIDPTIASGRRSPIGTPRAPSIRPSWVGSPIAPTSSSCGSPRSFGGWPRSTSISRPRSTR